MDSGKLNANTAPLTAAVPNITELIAIMQETHPSLVTTNMCFLVPFQESYWVCFAFMGGDAIHFHQILQGY